MLPSEIRSRRVDGVNGLSMYCLEAGEAGRPCVLLLHGFPELAYSWRKIMSALAAAGFHALAPDQRGYGQTTGWDPRYDGDLASYRMLNIVADARSLLAQLGIAQAHVVGHDFGSPVAAYAALTRPQLFHSVVLMSAPFGGAPVGARGGAPVGARGGAPVGARGGVPVGARSSSVHEDLAKLGRKHYQWYYSTREADDDMRRCRQGVHAFLRAYYHYKSADWPGNKPFALEAWNASELAKLPTYYIMDLDQGMAETVAPYLPARAPAWLTDEELAVYAQAFERHGFQGGLQWYRCATHPVYAAELSAAVAGRKIGIPSMFIAGASDWGVYQKPGEFERMQSEVCTDFRGAHLIEGAGHWVQQEQPEKTSALLVEFLRRVR